MVRELGLAEKLPIEKHNRTADTEDTDEGEEVLATPKNNLPLINTEGTAELHGPLYVGETDLIMTTLPPHAPPPGTTPLDVVHGVAAVTARVTSAKKHLRTL